MGIAAKDRGFAASKYCPPRWAKAIRDFTCEMSLHDKLGVYCRIMGIFTRRFLPGRKVTTTRMEQL